MLAPPNRVEAHAGPSSLLLAAVRCELRTVRRLVNILRALLGLNVLRRVRTELRVMRVPAAVRVPAVR